MIAHDDLNVKRDECQVACHVLSIAWMDNARVTISCCVFSTNCEQNG